MAITIGELIFLVLVVMQGLFFLVGLGFMIAYITKYSTNKSDKLYYIASALWAISPIFSMVGVFFGFFL